MNVWEIAILKTIKFPGGEAGLPEIYRALPQHIKLSESDTMPTKWGGRPAYRHQVRSHLTNLCAAGDIERTGVGRYRLTLQGKCRLEAAEQALS